MIEKVVDVTGSHLIRFLFIFFFPSRLFLSYCDAMCVLSAFLISPSSVCFSWCDENITDSSNILQT